MKNKNILLLLESHVDKIVLVVYVLVSLFLLWVYVIGSPYSEKVFGRKLGPSEIDKQIKKKAEAAASELDKPAPLMPPVPKYLSDYDRQFTSSISGISSSVSFPYPGVGDVVVKEARIYTLPEIPSLAEVAVGSLRGAAKIPTEEIGPDRPYASAMSEIGDIDLVTVSAWFNVQALYDNFQQSFMGPRLKTSWRDARLAAPVFARLDVQRRTRQSDGNWGQWEMVPRTAIDLHRKLLMELPLSLDDASFGVDIWMSQYDIQEVQHDILQPEAYFFTVSRQEWMAPEFLDETLDIMKKQVEQAERERRETLRREREANRSRGRRADPQSPGRNPRGGEMTGRETTGRTPRTPAVRERTMDDVQADFEKTLLSEKSDVKSMQEDSLLVWAHDDTAEPGKTYQYRIRLGVFNPIAGKDWFQSEQADYKNQLVLWSDYSEPTTELSVPKRIYVFPMDVIADKDTPNDIEGVQVQVAKYYLGRWRDFDFDVYPGEVIGYEVEDTQGRGGMPDGTGGYEQPMMGGTGTEQSPDRVDFTSDITLVDVIREVVWGSRLRRSVLHKMLYYDAEKNLRQVAVGIKYWDSDTSKIYDEIQKSMAQGVERRSPGGMPGTPGTPGEEMDDEMMDF